METSATPRLPHRIRRLYQLQAQAIGDVLKPHGLARSQWQVLSHVSRAGTMGQRELHGLLMVEPATLTGIIDGLVTKGWLERLGHPEDKRCRMVALTEAGKEKMRAIPDVVEIVQARMVEGVSERDLRAFDRAVEKMTDNLGRRQAG